MFFRSDNGVTIQLLVALIIALLANTISYAQQSEQSATLDVKPSTCVSLNQGRNCYAQLSITWSVQNIGDFCLIQKQSEQSQKILTCWKKSKGSAIYFEFESNESITYQLINNDKKPLAQATIDVSWVHKNSPRKRRWRLF